MGRRAFLLTAMVLPTAALAASPSPVAEPSYFEGRWAMHDEDCRAPTNWTMISGGNFVSENLAGTWEWGEGELLLRLDDLAIDEETGEAGGRFRLNGPVQIIGPDRFDLAIAPDVYHLQRCPDQ
jgi:hypothetical protein